MKAQIILSLMMILASSQVIAANLSMEQLKIVERADRNFYLIKKRDAKKILFQKEKKLEVIKLNVSGASSHLVSVEKIPKAPGYFCVVYFAGESGTKVILKEHRCALYNFNEQRFEGDFPWKILKDKNPAKGFKQPIYQVENKQLKIMFKGKLLKSLRFTPAVEKK